ncbi:MAG TPA: hypothetical protein VGF46_12510 [Gaiellales bacterium]|jgi:hypothetical protein
MDSSSDRKAERNAARRRIVRITQATAGAAVLTTGVVAVLAATAPAHETTTAGAKAAVVSATVDQAVTLAQAETAPETSSDAPVATAGGS